VVHEEQGAHTLKKKRREDDTTVSTGSLSDAMQNETGNLSLHTLCV
jgi:hypothetical protein